MVRGETTMSKIRIRVADIEIEFEGSEEFIQEKIPELLQDIAHMKAASDSDANIGEVIDEISEGKRELLQDLSINTIAQRIGVKSGSELVVAAAAYLTFVKKESTFPRSAILKTMKEASHYYKKSYSKNLTASLKRLVKNGVLLEKSSGSYSLSEKARKELEDNIAK